MPEVPVFRLVKLVDSINVNIRHWREPVDDASDLPMTGNECGDARVVKNENAIYIWDCSTSSWVKVSGSGGAETFIDLTDTPSSYSGSSGKLVRVKVTEDGLEFVEDTSIHKNVNGEINSLTEKITPADNDVLLIEDSADGYSKKKVKISNLPTGGYWKKSGDNIYYDEGWVGIGTDDLNVPFVIMDNIPGIRFARPSMIHSMYLTLGGAGNPNWQLNWDPIANVQEDTSKPSWTMRIMVNYGNEWAILYNTPGGTPSTWKRLIRVEPDEFSVNTEKSGVKFRVIGQANDYLLYVDVSNNRIGIGNNDPQSPLDINGNRIRIRGSFTPSGSSDPSGNVGDIAWDDNYLYIKTNSGWKRVPLQTF